MIRDWVTVEYRGRGIERRVYTNQRGQKYVRIHDRRYLLSRLKADGRILEEYSFGKEDDRDESR